MLLKARTYTKRKKDETLRNRDIFNITKEQDYSLNRQEFFGVNEHNVKNVEFLSLRPTYNDVSEETLSLYTETFKSILEHFKKIGVSDDILTFLINKLFYNHELKVLNAPQIYNIIIYTLCVLLYGNQHEHDLYNFIVSKYNLYLSPEDLAKYFCQRILFDFKKLRIIPQNELYLLQLLLYLTNITHRGFSRNWALKKYFSAIDLIIYFLFCPDKFLSRFPNFAEVWAHYVIKLLDSTIVKEYLDLLPYIFYMSERDSILSDIIKGNNTFILNFLTKNIFVDEEIDIKIGQNNNKSEKNIRSYLKATSSIEEVENKIQSYFLNLEMVFAKLLCGIQHHIFYSDIAQSNLRRYHNFMLIPQDKPPLLFDFSTYLLFFKKQKFRFRFFEGFKKGIYDTETFQENWKNIILESLPKKQIDNIKNRTLNQEQLTLIYDDIFDNHIKKVFNKNIKM